jgi:hypothetical protein
VAFPDRNTVATEVALGVFDENQRSKQRGISLINAFPLLLIPVAVYNILALFSIGSVDPLVTYTAVTQTFFSIPMPSPGSKWPVSIGDIILLGGLICLFFEMLKSTRSDNTAIVNHSFSMLLFIVCLVEFLLARPFATSTFFLLTAMTFMDVLAGFIVTAIAARKDIGFGNQ